MEQIVLNNRYRILGLVGEGGMARVYKAEDRLLERKVAIKVLREQYASDAAFLARFRQEARAAAGLAHPHIVSVYDVGVDGNWNYIVMEYVEGLSLKDLILQGAPFASVRAIDIAQQILSALAFAHQKGIVHRDIKPQNILITTDGNAKVADFGIARAAGGAQLTETGVVVGSVHYFAPEQARGETATPASDIYAVGIVMYEMLTGKLPFQGENTLSIALKHVQDAPTPPTRLNPLIPAQVESILLKALAKDAAERFADADEMKHALSTYRSLGEQLTAPVNISTLRGTAKQAMKAMKVPPPIVGTPRGRSRDWFTIAVVVLILGFLGASVPIGARVYELYFIPPPTPKLAPTFTATATATPEPRPTSAPIVKVPVPSLLGTQFTEAKRELEDLDLQIRIVDEQYSDNYPARVVITQTPPQGTEVQTGFIVDVSVSKGPTLVVVPDVVNSSVNAAISKLIAVGLRSEIREDWHDRVPQGAIFEQQPGANAKVEKGSIVKLAVSRGKRKPEATPTISLSPLPLPSPSPTRTSTPVTTTTPMVTVPSVVGLPEGEARARIAGAGLSNTYSNYQGKGDIPDSELMKVPIGSVLSQQPPPGALKERGTTVFIAVRKN